MRIGLANLPLLAALDLFGPANFFLLALLKVLGQGIIGGSFFSYVFLFSAAGTFSSAAVMYGLRRLFGNKRLGFAGLGCAGAMASNGIQLVLARYFVFGPALRYLAPPFLASGFITGIALGMICGVFCRRSRWYAWHTKYARLTNTTDGAGADNSQETPPLPEPVSAKPEKAVAQGKREAYRLSRRGRWDTFFNADELFFAGLIMALLFLLSRPLESRVLLFVFFCLFAWLSGKKNNVTATVLFMAGIIVFNLFAPYGKVLVAFGPVRVTQGSLLAGLEKAVTLEGLIMLSGACIRSDLRLPGSVGALLGESLRMLERMRERKGFIKRGNVMEGIDRLLLEMEATDTEEQTEAPRQKPKRNVKSILVLSIMVILTAAIIILSKYLTQRR